MLRLLRTNADFRRLYGAQLISYGGDWFSTVALLGLILVETQSATLASALIVANLLPGAIFSPIAGSLADRFDRRKLMIFSDVANAALTASFLFVSLDNLWLGFVLAALIAMFKTVFSPAAQAAVPNLVSREDLPAANALSASAWGLMLAVGAALGGAATGLFGREFAFTVDALSYLLSAFLLMRIRKEFQQHTPVQASHRRPKGSHRADFAELFRFIKATPTVWSLLIVKGGFGLTAGVMALVAAAAEQDFHAGAAGIGFLMSARGLGALVGPILFRRWFAASDRSIFRGIVLAFGVFGMGYMVFGRVNTLWLAAVGAFIAHIGGGAQWALSTLGLQRFTPDYIRGRVFGVDFMLVAASISLSVTVAGVLADIFGAQPVAFALATAGFSYALIWPLVTKRFWPAEGDSIEHEDPLPPTRTGLAGQPLSDPQDAGSQH